jgi:hypothetical protein
MKQDFRPGFDANALQGVAPSAMQAQTALKAKLPPAKPASGFSVAVRGRIPVPAELATQATRLARDFFRASITIDFADEAIDVTSPVTEPTQGLSWVPRDELRALGFKLASEDASSTLFVMTYGADKHVDTHGPVLLWVLLNDGLEFRQGKERHRTQAGEWHLFNDRLPHEVATPPKTPEDAMYLAWSVPLARLED